VRSVDDAEKDIYAWRHGRQWAALARSWWRYDAKHKLANHIVFLTTEAVPVAAARKAVPDINIVDFEADQVPRDCVETHALRGVNAENLGVIVAEKLVELGDPESWEIISNRCADLHAWTHASARGTNAVIGRNVLQTCTFLPPDQYEMAQAVNAWTGRRDLVLMTHIDELNQSCGRNRRFRRIGDERHVLLINKRLYDRLNAAGALAHMRYDLMLQVDSQKRTNAKRK